MNTVTTNVNNWSASVSFWVLYSNLAGLTDSDKLSDQIINLYLWLPEIAWFDLHG